MTVTQRKAIINMMSLTATQLAHLLLGVAALCWAVALVSGSATHPALVILLDILPTSGWVAVFSAISTLELCALAQVGKMCRVLPYLRGAVALMWVFIAISLLLSNLVAAGDAMVAMVAIWLFLRQAVRDGCNGGD